LEEFQMDPDTPRSEAFVPLKRGTPPDGGVVAAVFCATVGLLWLGTCLWMLSLVVANEPTFPTLAACLVGIALGVAAVASQAPHLSLALWFERPRAAVAVQNGPAGGAFTFRYSQRVEKPATADLTCSLILREAVARITADGTPAPSTWVDHLVEAQRGFGRATHPGDLLQTGCTFAIPTTLRRRFGLGDGKLSWIVKVRVCMPDQSEFWEEFALPFEPVVGSEEAPAPWLAEPGRFSVMVLRIPDWFRPEPTPEALLEVAPHLHRVHRLPVRVLETLSRDEAERACRRLDAAGVAAALYCDDQLVERRALHNLPIPQGEAEPAIDTLPIPLTVSWGVVDSSYAAIEPHSRAPQIESVTLRRAG
jgi:hypothetical protein